MSDLRPTLDCQDCGKVLQHLTPEQERQVATRPYDFIVFCSICARGRRVLDVLESKPDRIKWRWGE